MTGGAATGLAVTLQGPADGLAAAARRLERLGVDSIWTGDYFQAGPVRAAVIGAATERVEVGTHVLQAFARSPLATALMAQELQTLTGERFRLGLGSQLPVANQRWHGVDLPAPVSALREYVAAVRVLLESPGAAAYAGEHFAFRVPALRARPAPEPAPIWIGAAGPGTIRLAAQVADGLAGHLLWTYEHVAARVRPLIGDQPLMVPRMVALAPDAQASLARRVAHYLTTPAYQNMLAGQGIILDRIGLRDALRRVDTDHVASATAAHLREWSITTPEQMTEHRRAAAAAGIDTLMLLVPADPRSPERTREFESDLTDLIGSCAADDARSAQVGGRR